MREVYSRWLPTAYYVGRGMVPLMETALDRARTLTPGDAVASGVAEYLEKHIPEETHSDEPGGAVLDDLEAIGVDTTRVRTALPPPKIAALLGTQYYWILHYHPVAILGFLELEAYHAHVPTLERLIERTGLPREGFGQLLLHAKLDVAHARELHRVLDSLPLEPWHEHLIGVSALQTVALVTDVTLDVLEDVPGTPAAIDSRA